MNIIISIVVGLFLFLAQTAKANTVGTEYQNFAPTYSGLDFTSVESSETIRPCMCSLSLFFNYAKNTLTYSDTYYAGGGGTENLKGQRANDFLIGADVMLGVGLTDYWDFGIALPFVVTAKNDDPYGVSYFDKFGLTEIRPMTKLRFYGDREGGLAIALSANFNMIDDNPFAGEKPGPTVNLQLIGDTTTNGGLKLAWNLGYRKRSPGDPIANPSTGLPPPFKPFKDAWIFGLALAKHFESIKSDLLAELVGNHSGKLNEDDSARKAQQATELNVGLRHDWSKSFVVHGGLGTKFANAQSSPDIRAYIGANMSFGPICGTTTSNEAPRAEVQNAPQGNSAQTALSMPVTAKNIAAYRWKIGSTPKMNCHVEDGYSDETPGELSIDTDITNIPDGGITLCALAKNTDGVWQSLNKPTIIRWVKARPAKLPVAVVKNYPVGESSQTELEMPVSAINPKDYSAYRWKIGRSNEIVCTQEDGYSEPTPPNQPILVSIKDIPDGGITLCALAKNLGGYWQPLNRPTIIRWVKKAKAISVVQKDGYELFRLSAEVLFDFDKDNIRQIAQDDLNRIATYLKQKPYKKVIIEGHTDSKGSDEYNMTLSLKRAKSVKSWLVEKYGFEASKFEPVGKGETTPVATNDTDTGRQKNRRVEFKIYR